MYTIVFTEDAKKDLKELNKKAPQAVSKLSKLLEEIREHPRTGTGQVVQLKGYDGSVYSRRITKEHGSFTRSTMTLWKFLFSQHSGIIDKPQTS